MRRALIAQSAAAFAAVAAGLGFGTSGAGTAASPSITLRSGGYVVFRETSVQCLVFEPIARIPGRRGILCFVGRPKKHRPGAYWAVLTPTDGFYDTNTTDPGFRAITSGTTIRSTVTTCG